MINKVLCTWGNPKNHYPWCDICRVEMKVIKITQEKVHRGE